MSDLARNALGKIIFNLFPCTEPMMAAALEGIQEVAGTAEGAVFHMGLRHLLERSFGDAIEQAKAAGATISADLGDLTHDGCFAVLSELSYWRASAITLPYDQLTDHVVARNMVEAIKLESKNSTDKKCPLVWLGIDGMALTEGILDDAEANFDGLVVSSNRFKEAVGFHRSSLPLIVAGTDGENVVPMLDQGADRVIISRFHLVESVKYDIMRALHAAAGL